MAKKSISLDDIVSDAKASFSGTTSIGVEIPDIVEQGEERADALVYSVIRELQSEGGRGNLLYRNYSYVAYALPAPIDIIDLHSANWEGVAFGANRGLVSGVNTFSTIADLNILQTGASALSLLAHLASWVSFRQQRLPLLIDTCRLTRI